MKKTNNDWSLKTVINNCETTGFQQTNLSSRYTESMFTFGCSDVANGTINTFITPDMEISKMDIHSKGNLVTVQEDSVERYVCTFVYKGSIKSNFANADISLEQNSLQHTFVHAQANGSTHTIAAGSTSLLYINLKPELLQSLIPDWQQHAGKLYDKNNLEKFFVSPSLPIQQNGRLQHILASMYGDTFSGVTRSLYMEAKALELLALQLDELLHHTSNASPQTFALSKTDHEKVVAMYVFISENYLEPLSLATLARQFTLNEFKIKKGFKQVYGQSVFNHIHTLRMEKAQSLLQQGDMMVNEVSDLLGYSSIHNFSNAFYKMYNYRPSSLKGSRSFAMV